MLRVLPLRSTTKQLFSILPGLSSSEIGPKKVDSKISVLFLKKLLVKDPPKGL